MIKIESPIAPPMKAPILGCKATTIKRYDYETCYDGRSSIGTRNYSDEDVISTMIAAHLKRRPPSGLKVSLLREEWSWSKEMAVVKGVDRLFETIYQQGPGADLMICPLYHHQRFHHMFFAFDFRNHLCLYFDPASEALSGGDSQEQNRFVNLFTLLVQGTAYPEFAGPRRTRILGKPQQTDGYSCGPLVALALIEVIDYYDRTKSIGGFQLSEGNSCLALQKLNLMNLSNSILGDDEHYTNEVMLGTRSLFDFLWRSCGYPSLPRRMGLGWMTAAGLFLNETQLRHSIAGTLDPIEAQARLAARTSSGARPYPWGSTWVTIWGYGLHIWNKIWPSLHVTLAAPLVEIGKLPRLFELAKTSFSALFKTRT